MPPSPLAVAAFLCTLMLAVQGFPAFLIELNSGAKFVTGHYWEENGRLWFDQAGGSIGIDKNRVRQIRESEFTELVRENAPPGIPPTNGAEKPHPASASETSTAKTETAPAEPSSDIIKPPDGILDEFNGLKNRVTAAEDVDTEALYALAEEMSAFRKKILDKALGHIYDRQLLELSGMLDTVETIIKSRSQ